MRELAASRPLRVLLATVMLSGLLPWPAWAQSPSAPAEPATAEQAVADSRELLKSGDYDRAIEVLRAALANGPHAAPLARDLYLQLIKTYVTLGNDLKFRPQGREASNLNYRAARELIVECLSQPALRRTRPEPATDYPPEMVRLFAEVRAERFGAFRVGELVPAGATVTFDGDTLAALSDAARALDDVPAGTHAVVVSAPGYRTLAQTIGISPGATLERTYQLTRRRSRAWYATRGLVVVGAAVGLGLLVGRDDGQGTAPGEPLLPPAPPPPSN